MYDRPAVRLEGCCHGWVYAYGRAQVIYEVAVRVALVYPVVLFVTVELCSYLHVEVAVAFNIESEKVISLSHRGMACIRRSGSCVEYLRCVWAV